MCIHNPINHNQTHLVTKGRRCWCRCSSCCRARLPPVLARLLAGTTNAAEARSATPGALLQLQQAFESAGERSSSEVEAEAEAAALVTAGHHATMHCVWGVGFDFR